MGGGEGDNEIGKHKTVEAKHKTRLLGKTGKSGGGEGNNLIDPCAGEGVKKPRSAVPPLHQKTKQLFHGVKQPRKTSAHKWFSWCRIVSFAFLP